MEIDEMAEVTERGAVWFTEMEFRVAQAIDDASENNIGPQLAEQCARAAIRAMREPTEDMVDMGGRGIARDTQYFGGAMTLARYSSHEVEAQNRLRADAAWAAMIEAASPTPPSQPSTAPASSSPSLEP